jgi:CRP/FNR family transcriptional regulator, cyclic AMP receptor protein
MSIMNIIKASPLFHELYDEEIDALIEKCSVMSLNQGEAIFKEGDSGDEIFLILTGAAEVRRGELVLAQLRKGDLFGEMVLLNDNIRSADIIASSYTDVLVMDYKSIFSFYQTNPKLFSILILNLSRLLAKRLHKTGQDLKELSEQLASYQKKNAA